jgi:nucleotide-binding universal stress UspA family protein
MTSTRTQPAITAEQLAGPSPVGRVLVGVDGSYGSRAALRWALLEARAHDVGVHAVLAFQHHEQWNEPLAGQRFPLSTGGGVEHVPGGAFDPAENGLLEAETAATNALEAAVAAALQDLAAPTEGWSARVSREVREGHPAQVLLDLAADGDLIVVGSRGHGGFAGALLGSISQHVVTHARCPVVVVPSRHLDPR